MSDDLEKRLRDAWKLKFSDEALGLFTEAADRITHLEAENRAMETILNACTDGTDWVYGQVPDELARLRSENEALYEAQSDNRNLVKKLDVIWNGEDGAAKQASLCDMVAQIGSELPKLRALKGECERLREAFAWLDRECARDAVGDGSMKITVWTPHQETASAGILAAVFEEAALKEGAAK